MFLSSTKTTCPATWSIGQNVSEVKCSTRILPLTGRCIPYNNTNSLYGCIHNYYLLWLPSSAYLALPSLLPTTKRLNSYSSSLVSSCVFTLRSSNYFFESLPCCMFSSADVTPSLMVRSGTAVDQKTTGCNACCTTGTMEVMATSIKQL